MPKLLARNSLSIIALLLAFAAPSALAAHDSHHANSHAAHHRRGHHNNTKHKAQRGRRAGHSTKIRLAATTSSAVLLGESTLESHVDYVNAGQAEAFRVQAGASDVAGLARIYIDSHNAAHTLVVGLYSNSTSGHPASLLSSGSISTVQAGTWNSVTLVPTPLASGHIYWLAVLGQQGTLRYRDREKGTCPSETSGQTNLTALSVSWRTGRVYATCPVSAYVTAAAPVFGLPVPVGPAPEPVSVEPTPVEPTPIKPANEIPPSITGTTVESQSLSATNGTWSGTPTSFGYQWQDCNASGEACLNVVGATTQTHQLLSSDVGHTVRVVVTAQNSGGATSATSSTVGSVSALPPTAGFTTSPTSAVVGQAVTLDASSSRCPAGPCTYTWSDDGSTTQPVPALWPLGSGQALAYTFSTAGTKYVRLVVTDATGQTATVEHNLVVEASPPSLPTPPSNTALPSVSGTTQEGQTLTAANGTWAGNTPISFAYQWQDCNASGGECSNVTGATSASYQLGPNDVSHTVRLVVTATNAGGSAAATSAATAVVTATVVSPTPPNNVTAPTISGTAQVGQALTASSGTWSGSTPMTYAYQWQDCNSTGENCTNVVGVNSSSHSVTEAELAHTVRVVVTASNSAGNVAQASIPTSLVSAVTSCTVTLTSSASAATIASTIVSAHDGDTVCLASGTYPTIHINGATHGSYVTVRPVPGATATVGGFEVANSAFLRFQGLHMTAGFNMRDGSTYSGSHDYQFLEDTFENDVYGIVLYGGSGPIKKVLIEHDYMRKIDFPGEACNPGYAGGQGVTIWYADGVTIAHNTFKEISWHYIQGGAAGTAGVTVDHNLFEGPIPADRLSCTHLNVWQIWDGGSNDTFTNNIVKGKPGSPAAVTPILFETGAGGGTCSASLSNSVVTNNLFVYSSTAYAVQILTTTNLTYTNNTSIGSEYGIWLDRSDTCGAGANYDVERNISVENIGRSPDFALGECMGTCVYDHNVSQDSSASIGGSTHYAINWKPNFVDTIGYEPNGLSFAAGYQGGGGP